MATPKVWNGSSWVPFVAKVWNGSAWEDQLKFYDGTQWVELYETGPTVIVAAAKSITDFVLSGSAYTWVGVNNDGDLYSSTTGTTPNVSYETWLDSGLNSEVWVEATLVGLGPDALTSGSDSTGVRLACTSSRAWGYTATAGNALSGQLQLDFYDAASGGNLLDTQTVTLNADATGL